MSPLQRKGRKEFKAVWATVVYEGQNPPADGTVCAAGLDRTMSNSGMLKADENDQDPIL